MNEANLNLFRKVFTDKSTISPLYFGTILQCQALEPTCRNRDLNRDGILQPSEKIAGVTALPAGRYQVKMDWSPHFQRQMPFFFNDWCGRSGTVNRQGKPFFFNDAMFHWGNRPADTKSCILVGRYDPATPDWLSDSQKAFNDLEPKILEALGEGNLFLNIAGGYRMKEEE